MHVRIDSVQRRNKFLLQKLCYFVFFIMNGTIFGQIQSGETVLLTALRVRKSLEENGVGLHI
jgi:hypothetical protein